MKVINQSVNVLFIPDRETILNVIEGISKLIKNLLRTNVSLIFDINETQET